MPQEKQPITRKPTVEDESTGNGGEFHGAHREDDEGLPGKGSTQGGLNRQSDGARGGKQNEGLPRGDSGKPRGLRESRR